MEQGYIKIFRDILEFEWYTEPTTARLYIHLLIKANHKDGFYRGEKVMRGQVYTGRKLLEKETGISQQSIRTSIKKLESTNHLTIDSTKQRSIITLKNYHKFQSSNHQTNQQLTNDQPTTNHKQECNNEKNVKKDFYELWEKYPKKDGKKKALSSYTSANKRGFTKNDVRMAMDNYLAKLDRDKTENQFIKNGGTWFNNWEDWLVVDKQPDKPMGLADQLAAEDRARGIFQ